MKLQNRAHENWFYILGIGLLHLTRELSEDIIDRFPFLITVNVRNFHFSTAFLRVDEDQVIPLCDEILDDTLHEGDKVIIFFGYILHTFNFEILQILQLMDFIMYLF